MAVRAVTCLRVLFIISFCLSVGTLAPVRAIPLKPGSATGPGPVISIAEHQDLSRPLRELSAAPLAAYSGSIKDIPLQPLSKPAPDPAAPPAVNRISAQSLDATNLVAMPAPLKVWEGVPNRNGVLPPDTNGDVGPNHYVQWVNLSLAIWDKQGHLLVRPVNGNMIWFEFGGVCEKQNNGDPIVLYDSLADRWFISQFSLPGSPDGYYQCIAVSQSPDPTGSWYRYAFKWSATLMNDYGKFGVWSDGYYLSVNQYSGQNLENWGGAGVAVFERDKMLQGLPARMITFDLLKTNPNFGGLLPADLDGQRAPPVGAPNPFVEWDDAWLDPQTQVQTAPDELRIWNFHVDWNQPALSSFGNHLQPNLEIPTMNVDPHSSSGPLWITQPNTLQKLDALSDRLMYRLQYRNFGDHQTLVSNHTVDADGQSHAGIHWFELRAAGLNSWTLFQQGVHAPDSNNRWMGSLAMDGSGNLALGYSLSGPNLFPSIAYSGRLASDPVGTMPQGEMILAAGAGSQTSPTGRWGDYSTMSVDPVDDCTFWFTQEIYATTNSADWKTKIGSFRFPSCTKIATGVLYGMITSSAGGMPLPGVQVTVAGLTTTSDADGLYRLILPPGNYLVTAALFGYSSESGVLSIASGGNISQDFILKPLTNQLVFGKVSDGSGHTGMPLYARLDIPNYPASPVYTDPRTGVYQLTLPVGVPPFAFTVSAVGGGYQPVSRTVSPVVDLNPQDFILPVDLTACTAPGYSAQSGSCLPLKGGLVVGIVQDDNRPPLKAARPLFNARVIDGINGVSAVTGQNPAGGYSLFTAAGRQELSASYPGYGSLTELVTVLLDGAVQEDFNLPAGHLTLSPGEIEMSVHGLGPQPSLQITIHNEGSGPVNFSLTETPGLISDLNSTGPFAPAGRRLSPKRMGERSAMNIYEYTPPAVPVWPGGGSVLHSWTTGLAAPWGLAVAKGTVWVNDAADGKIHAFSSDGLPQPGEIALEGSQAYFGDLAYDPIRNRLWQAAVGGEPCVVELDPSTDRATGVKICPPFGNSQRGLAYDPVSQTFFSGTWNDANLSHFDRGGRLLDSANLGINISGIAYHPGSGLLYILSNAAVGFDVYVVEAHRPYRILGGFDLPEMADFGQAGLDMTPDGHLWAVDAITKQVLEIATGEAPFSNSPDVTWLTESITSGSLAAGESLTVNVAVDANQFSVPRCLPIHQATLTLITDSPYDNGLYRVPPFPITVHSESVPCQYYFPRIMDK